MARLINRLTKGDIGELTDPGFYADGQGLYLQISKWQTKSWVLRFTLDGRTRHLGLGSYNTVKLSDARERARKARLLIVDGVDPIEDKRARRDARRTQTAETTLFRDAVKEFLNLHSPTWKNAKHKWQWQRSLEQFALKNLGGRPVGAIDGALITETLAPIWQTKTETARRVKQRIERVCQWIKDGKPLPSQNGNGVRHHPAPPFAELGDFMVELAKRQGHAARALEFCILTAGRTSEVLGARWDEIDLHGKVWTVPAERMKAGRPHRVPLSSPALALLRNQHDDGSGLVFLGPTQGKPLSNMAMLMLLRKMGRRDLTVHGTRSAFSDWCRERTAYPRDVVEMALAHAIKDKTEAAYRRGDALPKRALLMQEWANYCYSPAVEATVTDLAEVRAAR
jgi:integrase